MNIEINHCPGFERLTCKVAAREAARLWADAFPSNPAPLLSSFEPEALSVVALITNWRVMNAALIERLHARCWRALFYTVNDADVAQRLIADGIDGIITDRLSPPSTAG